MASKTGAMMLSSGPYLWDASNKLLYCNDMLMCEGDEALMMVGILGEVNEWKRVYVSPPMFNRWNDGSQEPLAGLGHSSNRHYDRKGSNLRSNDLSIDDYLNSKK